MKIIRLFAYAIVALISVAMVVYGAMNILGFIPQPEHIPELDGTIVGDIMKLPRWHIGIVLVFFSAFPLMAIFLDLAEKSGRRQSKKVAWGIAKEWWRIKEVMVGEVAVYMYLISEEDIARIEILVFPVDHPDAERLKSLRKSQVVRFIYANEEPGDWGPINDTSSYLRLRTNP